MLLLNRKMYDIFNQIFYEAKYLAQRSERHIQFKRNRTVFILITICIHIYYCLLMIKLMIRNSVVVKTFNLYNTYMEFDLDENCETLIGE